MSGDADIHNSEYPEVQHSAHAEQDIKLGDGLHGR